MSHKALDVETSPPPANVSSITTTTITDENGQKDSVTDSPIANIKSTDEVNKSQIQATFRQQMARLYNPNAPTDKV